MLVSAAMAQADAGLPPSLVTSIERLSKNASIVRIDEVDASECDSIPPHPGIARGDFNGDGQEDVAVLLKTRVAEQTTTWQNKTLREADFLFVFFLKDGKGGYTTRTLDKFAGYIPGHAYVESNPPKKRIAVSASKEGIVFSNAAAIITFCGKSAAAYTVVGKKVKKIPLSD